MSVRTLVTTARASGVYRCTGLGQTEFFRVGMPLRPHQCKKGVLCQWELRQEDNMALKNAILVLIGNGDTHAIITDKLPEVGMHYNIRAEAGLGLETGAHRVTAVDDHSVDGGVIRMHIELVGDLSPELPIHEVCVGLA